MGLFSPAALAALGVTEKTPDPAGGRIGRENGHLTGYLEEKIYFDVLARAPGFSLAELTDGYRRAQALYFSRGITTVQEGMFVPEMLPMAAVTSLPSNCFAILISSDYLKNPALTDSKIASALAP